MKPIFLSIAGLYSYEQKQEIDFHKLSKAGIFGIFGAVGSGKSTILEAISIALFGTSQRLNTKDNLQYNLLNLRSNNLEICFEFEHANGNIYKAIFTLRRNRNDFSEISKKEHRFFISKNNEWIPMPEKTKGAEILQITEENFHRTVVIPQGKFAEFLLLKGVEREKMLQDIFNLDKFDLAAPNKTLLDEAKLETRTCETRMEQFKDISPKLLFDCQLELEKNDSDLFEAEKKQVNTQTLVDKLTKKMELFEKIDKVKIDVNALEIKIIALPDVEKRYKEAFVLKNAFSQPYDRFNLAETRLNETKKTLDLSTSNLLITKKIFEEQSEILTSLEEQLPKFEKHKLTVLDLEIGIEIAKLFEALKKAQQRTLNAKKFIAAKELEVEETNKIIEQYEVDLEKHENAKSQCDEMKYKLHWEKTNEHAQINLNNAKDKLLKCNKQIQSLVAEWNIEKPQNLTFEIADFNALDLWYANVNLVIQEQIAALKTNETYFAVQIQLENFASHLHAGEPCLLCGATNHPNPLKSGTAKEKLAEIKAKIDTLEQSKSLNQKTYNTLLSISKQYLQYIENENIFRNEIAQFENNLNDSLKDKPNVSESNIYLKNTLAQINEIEKAIQGALLNAKQLFAKSKQLLSQSKLDLHNYNAELHKIEVDILQIETKIGEKASRLQLNDVHFFANFEMLSSWILQLDGLKNEIDLFERKYTDSKQKVNQLLVKLSADNSIMNTNQEQFNYALTNFEAAKLIVDKLLVEHNCFDINEMIVKTKDIQHLQEQLESLHQTKNKLNLIKIELLSLQKQAGEKVEESVLQEAKSTLLSVLAEVKTLIENKAILSEKIGRIKNGLNELEKLNAELERLKKRVDGFLLLENLFRSKGFVSYISSVYMKQLANEANKRFRILTRNQFELALNNDNGFDLIDHLNDGKLRSVKTLSGGQTFQVSFSLALALADLSQAYMGYKQSFFFMDEGFGALDNEALQMVLNALHQLKSENRTIGLITHMDRLQEELGYYLKISLEPNKGSEITSFC